MRHLPPLDSILGKRAAAARRRGCGIAALQEDWVMEKLKLPPETLLDDLRLLFADGTHLAGADVYR